MPEYLKITFSFVLLVGPFTMAEEGAPPAQIQACISCHGTNGISTDRFIPNLAGQMKVYIVNQLVEFKAKRRASPDSKNVMQINAAALGDADMQIVADYYSKQPGPIETPEEPAVLVDGKAIFNQGIPDRGVPVCKVCHGPTALGFKTFPRLAGQHASYIANQFRWFLSGDRPSQSSMPQTAQKLNDAEIKAVANYLQSIKEDPSSEP
jgi:cytochrome c553